jgi:hypothetical protein
MKKSHYFITKAAVVIAAILLSMIVGSCKKDISDPSLPKHTLKSDCGQSSYTLWAGQNINAGNLLVWNDETNLYIEYQITSTDPNLALNELHLWAGKDINECPDNNNGNPKVGQFPYYANPTSSTPAGYPYLTNSLDYTLTIPLNDIQASCEDIVYVAAHGKSTTETMWGAGTRFVPSGGNWATYSTYTICCGGATK